MLMGLDLHVNGIGPTCSWDWTYMLMGLGEEGDMGGDGHG